VYAVSDPDRQDGEVSPINPEGAAHVAHCLTTAGAKLLGILNETRATLHYRRGWRRDDTDENIGKLHRAAEFLQKFNLMTATLLVTPRSPLRAEHRSRWAITLEGRAVYEAYKKFEGASY
jgi:adenylylsulfate kinase-like enzyme